MDVFKFQDYLYEALEGFQDDEIICLMYDTALKSLRIESDIERLADALIDTAHTLLWTAHNRRGVEKFIEIMERNARLTKQARAQTDITQMTKKISDN